MSETNSRATALITGGSRGIGRAIALRLAEQGMNICLNYCGSEVAAEETAAACRAFGVETCIIKADISNAEEAANLCKQAEDTFGAIDVLVNNAGITRDNLILRMKESDFDAVVDTCLKGTWNCCKALSRSMLRRKSGRIINISSVVGLHGNAGQSNYAAAKAGILGLTKSLAKEFASKGITVNAVAPGFIQTDMTAVLTDAAQESILNSVPMKRMGTAAEVAEAVAFLAGPGADYITGQVLCVDGGMAM